MIIAAEQQSTANRKQSWSIALNSIELSLSFRARGQPVFRKAVAKRSLDLASASSFKSPFMLPCEMKYRGAINLKTPPFGTLFQIEI
jgi:hypothetical protein